MPAGAVDGEKQRLGRLIAARAGSPARAHALRVRSLGEERSAPGLQSVDNVSLITMTRAKRDNGAAAFTLRHTYGILLLTLPATA